VSSKHHRPNSRVVLRRLTCSCLCRWSRQQQVGPVSESGSAGTGLGALQRGQVAASYSGDDGPPPGQRLATRATSHFVRRDGAAGKLCWTTVTHSHYKSLMQRDIQNLLWRSRK
jgi:hypothetical protein